MKMCDKHWTMLRNLVDQKGMTHLVGDAETTKQNIEAELAGETPPHFDPLMNANWMIMGRAMEIGGLYLMTGDYCPICEAMKHTAHWPKAGSTEPLGVDGVEKHWTEGVIDAIHGMAIEKGLITCQ